MQDLNNQNSQENIPQPSFEKPFTPEVMPFEKNDSYYKKSFFTNILITLLICFFAASIISAAYVILNPNQKNSEGKPSFKTLKKTEKGEANAALIKIRGVIQETQSSSSWDSSQNASSLATKIRELAEEKKVKALVLDINSPGGTVGAVQDIYNAILYFKSKNKPVVAVFRDVAASGGYYIATAADKIVAQGGTITGSIGVIMQGMNIAPLLERFGVSVKPIKSAKHKDIGSPYREMTEEEKQLLQDMINDTYAQFLNAVKKARPNIPEEKLRLYADGRVWTGSQAKALGFVDEIGGMEKAKELLEKETGLKDIKIKNINSGTFADLGILFSSAQSIFHTKIEEVSTPKVSYLWTY